MPWPMPLSSLAVIPLILSVFFVQQWIPGTDRTFLQCSALQVALGSRVLFPGKGAYSASIESYWSQQEQQLSPACIVTPRNTKDVATAVWVLNTVAYTVGAIGGRQCHFAIRGGGHTPWAGSANIESGVTLDLNGMRDVSINSERTITSVGAGARWIDVYLKLDAMNVSVSGGRASNIGVAGLITGGGMSFFAPRYGFACDNVENFEIVLASGNVVNANAKENPDLWFALKGGSNNFGVITRLDLRTFPQEKLWGGLVYYPIETQPAQVKAFQALNAASDYDTYASAINTYGYSAAMKSWGVSNYLMYTKPKAYPATLAPFTDIKPQLFSTLRTSNLSDFTLEQGGYSPSGQRTFGNDAVFLNRVFDIFNATLPLIIDTPGLLTSLIFQALPASITEKSLATGGNALGLDPTVGPQVLMLISFQWANEADDKIIRKAADTIFAQVDVEAKARKLGHRWLYLNYAAAWQTPIDGYGPSNKARLRAVSKKYDPRGLFQTGVPGGYKLWP
ncbi:MAG: hypothetical protein Q9187_002128 [Circinaria calcarea]